jgi:hypothetical protein
MYQYPVLYTRFPLLQILYDTFHATAQFADITGTVEELNIDVPTVKFPPMDRDLTVPSMVPSYQTFSNQMDIVAKRLVDQARTDNRKLAMFYSGGIDSVSVLVALINADGFTDLVKSGKFEVWLTSASISEFPRMFYEKILPNYTICPANYDKVYSDPNIRLVTGDFGDGIFGPAWMSHYTLSPEGIGIMSDQWYPTLKRLWCNSDPQGVLLHLAEETIKKAPFPITTLLQASWWLEYAWWAQDEIFHSYTWVSAPLSFTDLTTNQKTFRWYHEPEFHYFSLAFMANNTPIPDYRNLKWMMKKYVVDNTGFTEFETKIKIGSQKQMTRSQFKLGIFEDLSTTSSVIWD